MPDLSPEDSKLSYVTKVSRRDISFFYPNPEFHQMCVAQTHPHWFNSGWHGDVPTMETAFNNLRANYGAVVSNSANVLKYIPVGVTWTALLDTLHMDLKLRR